MEENKTAARGEDIIAGRDVIIEALKAGHTIDSVYMARGSRTGSTDGIIAKVKQSDIPVKDTNPEKPNYLCGHVNHQGVVAMAAIKKYASPESLFRVAEERGEPPLLLIAGELENPHNLEAVLCTVECSGAHDVIVPRRRAAGLTFVVGKVSAGTAEYVPMVRVTNLLSTLEKLKERDVWIHAADTDGQDWYGVDYCGPAAVVIGSEGSRVSWLIRKESGFIMSLSMLGKISSLSASVACDVICCEVAWQRREIQIR